MEAGISDGLSTSNVTTVTMQVVDAKPFLSDSGYTVQANVPFSTSLNANINAESWTDNVSLPLSPFVLTQPTNGTVTTSGSGGDALFTYTPAVNFTGTDSFTYRLYGDRRIRTSLP